MDPVHTKYPVFGIHGFTHRKASLWQIDKEIEHLLLPWTEIVWFAVMSRSFMHIRKAMTVDVKFFRKKIININQGTLFLCLLIKKGVFELGVH